MSSVPNCPLHSNIRKRGGLSATCLRSCSAPLSPIATLQAFSMIKVQTLRLRGLCASSLLALAACSGTQADFIDVQTGSSEGTPLTTPTPLGDAVTAVEASQPQDQRHRRRPC